MSPSSLPCHFTESLLHSFLDGEVEGTQSLVVSVHMRRCSDCDSEARTVLFVRASLRREPPVDPAVVERLRRFVLSLA